MRDLFVAEPPAMYQTRPPIVTDCSVLAAILFGEPERDVAAQRLSGRSLHAPSLLDYEIANVAIKKHQRGWNAEAIRHALASYPQQTITLHRVDIASQCALAEAFGLSAHDAAYLWLAGALHAPLATFDRKLGQAAQRHLGTA